MVMLIGASLYFLKLIKTNLNNLAFFSCKDLSIEDINYFNNSNHKQSFNTELNGNFEEVSEIAETISEKYLEYYQNENLKNTLFNFEPNKIKRNILQKIFSNDNNDQVSLYKQTMKSFSKYIEKISEIKLKLITVISDSKSKCILQDKKTIKLEIEKLMTVTAYTKFMRKWEKIIYCFNKLDSYSNPNSCDQEKEFRSWIIAISSTQIVNRPTK